MIYANIQIFQMETECARLERISRCVFLFETFASNVWNHHYSISNNIGIRIWEGLKWKKVKVFLDRWTKHFKKPIIFSKASKNVFLKISRGKSYTFCLVSFSESKSLCSILLSCHYAKTSLTKLSFAAVILLRCFGL